MKITTFWDVVPWTVVNMEKSGSFETSTYIYLQKYMQLHTKRQSSSNAIQIKSAFQVVW
jgi:hypothetical protein